MTDPAQDTPEARRTGIRIDDPLLPATLDVLYLRPVLEALPPEWRTAVDLGAGCGDGTAELLSRGLRVLAVESDERLAERLRLRFSHESRDRRFQSPPPGASGGAGPAPLAGLLKANGFHEIGFARLGADDPTGADETALRELLARRAGPPAVVGFAAGSPAPERVRARVEMLRSHGYGTFDLLVRRDGGPCGGDPVAAERFAGPDLPPAWGACGGRPFRADIFAYHVSRPEGGRRVGPAQFLCDYQVLRSQHLLRAALRAEARAAARHAFPGTAFGMTGPAPASPARAELRGDVLAGGWSRFLEGRIGRRLGASVVERRGNDRDRSVLASSPFGRDLVATVPEPWVGAAAGPAGGAAGPSLRLADALRDLACLHAYADGRLPRGVVELSGGYGLAAYAYATASPEVAYWIVDHPEALAVQHYFLTLSLPHFEVDLVTGPEGSAAPGSIRLVPLPLAKTVRPAGDLLFCSHPHDSLSAAFKAAIVRSQGFGERNSYFAGEWTFEAQASDGREAVAA